MKNRLHWKKKMARWYLVLGCFLLGSPLFSQSFTFQYTGADTLFVGSDCQAALDWGHPNTVTFMANTGSSVDTSYIDTISNDLSINDLVENGEKVEISYFVQDTLGNDTIFILELVVADAELPVFDVSTLPDDITVGYDEVIPPAPDLSTITVMDNCGVDTLVYAGETMRPVDVCVEGAFTRSWYAEDSTGNRASYVQRITVLPDTMPPVWTMPPDTLFLTCDGSQDVDLLVSNWLLTGSGSGVGGQVSDTTHNFTGFTTNFVNRQQVQDVTFTVVDSCGNRADTIGVIVLTDTTAPVFTMMPVDTVVYCQYGLLTAEEWHEQHGLATAADTCTAIDNAVNSAHWSIVNIDTTSSACGDTLTYLTTFAVADDAGNSASAMATYQLIDTLPPLIAGVIADTSQQCTGTSADDQHIAQWFMAISQLELMDACGDSLSFVAVNYRTSEDSIGTWTDNATPFTGVSPGNDCNWYLDAYFVFEDNCGRQGADTARFSLIDTIAPVFDNIPNDTIVSCDSIPTVTIIATDNCDDTLMVNITETVDTTATEYVITRAWSVSDDCGNEARDTQVIMAIDTVAPVFTVFPNDTTVSCDTIPIPADVVALDNCTDSASVVITFSTSNNQGTNPDSCEAYSYTIRRVWSATDLFGNTDSAIQIVTVVDTVAPTFVVPADTTISCELADSLTITGEPTMVMDNCDTIPFVSFVDEIRGGNCMSGGVLDTVFRVWMAEDACGNIGLDTQYIFLIDTIAPEVVGIPADTMVQCSGMAIALPEIGVDITTMDNCGSGAALQFLGETNNQGTNPDSCDFYNYTITRSWRATDACGNDTVFTQNIVLIDTVAPLIICPDTIVGGNTAGLCAGTITLPVPVYDDECTSSGGSDSLVVTQSFSHPSGSDANNTPVDTLVFNLNFGALFPAKRITSDVTVTIALNGVDGEGAEESFNVIGEDGTSLGTTNLAPAQCDTSLTALTISADLANSYAADGFITLRLGSNGTGTGAVNNICAGGNATITAEYDYQSPGGSISLSYNIDGGAEEELRAGLTPSLSLGEHEITYFAEDCSGNRSSCTFIAVILDEEAPTFTCADTISVYTDSASCDAAVVLPFPDNFSDNCGFMNSYNERNTQAITFQNDANAGVVPDEIATSFAVSNPNAVGEGTLTIHFTGDNNDPGEFFQVFGENGVLLGNTALGDSTTECQSEVATTFTLPLDTINTWASDGQIEFRVVPNLDAANFSDFINPCDNLNAGNTDNQSSLEFELSFPDIVISYEVTDTFGNSLATGELNSPDAVIRETFTVGISEVAYQVSDVAGNEANCTFIVEVLDTMAPVLVCQSDIVINTNPSGRTTELVMLIDSLVEEMNDNCGIESVVVTPATVSCLDEGVVSITIMATDTSGNTATCQTDITVVNEMLEPTFSVGACSNDTLYLFADTTFSTPTSGTPNFTYRWTGPNGFTASVANPIIPGAAEINSGSYTLTIEGSTGCISEGTVFIDINDLDTPPIEISGNQFCSNEVITLTTSSVTCEGVAYQWLEVLERTDLPDTIVQIGMTNVPVFEIDNPTPGRHSYYLTVRCAECISLGSAVVSANVFDTPTAITSDSLITVCAGEDIILGTPSIDANCTYRWIGPGFSSDLPIPPVIEDARAANSGVYTLTVTKNGCVSESAFTIVNVDARPDRPLITNEPNSVACVGSSLMIRTGTTDADQYNWTNNTTLATYTTTIPQLVFDSVTTAEGGTWSVSVVEGGCESEESETVNILIERLPEGVPFFEGVACENRTVKLNVNPVLTNFSYQWTAADGTVYQGAAPNADASAQFTLDITSTNGCRVTRNLEIPLNPTPVVTAIFDSGDAMPCIIPENTDLQIISNVFPQNDGTYTFSWTTPAGTTLPPRADSILVIPNTTAQEANGIYALVVTNGAGCASDVATTSVEVADIPVPNPVINANQTNLCEGQQLVLTATEYSDISAEYHWQLTSILDTVTQSPQLVIDSVTTALTGQVLLQVFNGDCPSNNTASLNISVSNQFAQPTLTTDTLVCSGESIVLTTQPVAGATYAWEGPNLSTTSTVPNIIVTSGAVPENSGGYQVTLLMNGCDSEPSDPVAVTVNEVPDAPLVANGGNICLDNTDEFILFVDEETAPDNAVYRWFNAANDELVAGPNSFRSQIIDATNLNAGTYAYYATVAVANCESSISNTTEITLLETPAELAQTCTDTLRICDVEEATICAIAPQQGAGRWTTSATGVGIDNPTMAETTVSGLQTGNTYRFRWTLSNGICGDYSSAELIVIAGTPGAMAEVCSPLIEVCEGNEINLCAQAIPDGFAGEWSQPASQMALGVTITDAAATNTTITEVEPGDPFNTYTFFWTVTDSMGFCPIVDTVRVNLSALPDELASITSTALISCDGMATVTANSVSEDITGRWSSADNGVSIINPNALTTPVRNLQRGSNLLTWTLSKGACADYSSDEVTIFYEGVPIANDDAFEVGFGATAMLDVLANDELFGATEVMVTVLSGSAGGTTEVDANGNIIYTAARNYVGIETLTYELCNPNCIEDCTTATVTLDVGNDAACVAPTIITPNGDGINDAFVIPCIETGNFPTNEVIIFNQWGDEIYRSSPYNNDWQGTYNGEDVPVGTYYYIIQYDRNTEPTAGFLVIER